jgi:hypothetical protein
VKVENPVALRFILQDELYLLKSDKPMYENRIVAEPEIEDIANAVSIAKEPIPILKQPEPVIVAAAPDVKTQPISFNYLGKNLKNFLVLVHYPEQDFIDDAHLTALPILLSGRI